MSGSSEGTLTESATPADTGTGGGASASSQKIDQRNTERAQSTPATGAWEWQPEPPVSPRDRSHNTRALWVCGRAPVPKHQRARRRETRPELRFHLLEEIANEIIAGLHCQVWYFFQRGRGVRLVHRERGLCGQVYLWRCLPGPVSGSMQDRSSTFFARPKVSMPTIPA